MKSKIEQKEYKITEAQCKANINGVCSGCGGELTPIETVDNAHHPTYWPGCLSCESFCWGIPVLDFRIARTLVEQNNYIAYSHLGTRPANPADLQTWIIAQTKGATYTVREVLALYKHPELLTTPQTNPATTR